MNANRTALPCLLLLLAFAPGSLRAGALPERDLRGDPPRTTDTRWSFTPPASRAEWDARAAEIRRQVLVSCGLWPMPERTPLQARVFDRVERDGYSIEKVDLQPWPGVHLGGNLYRPLNRGPGPFPAILNPHGHWSKGRLEESEICSVPGRCASFARQGMIALSIDMIGYNDSQQFGGHRAAFLHPTNALWGVSLMGLQTWNAIRALDFLESLPEVDRTRLACTGASGGGTQTFILGAIDDRLAVQVPMVMVSHSMQGGCMCENAPGLRVNHFNVEIAAAAAPRPQLLVAATGDWTRATLEMEGPAVASVYSLLGAADRFRAVRLNYNHNYNRKAREIVYGWFGRWLRGLADATPIPEAPHAVEPTDVVRVFPDGSRPADALSEAAFTGSLVDRARRTWETSAPTDAASQAAYVAQWLPAWRHTLLVDPAPSAILAATQATERAGPYSLTRLVIGRDGCGDRIPAAILAADRAAPAGWAVLTDARGMAASFAASREPTGLAAALAARGLRVLLVDVRGTGTAIAPARNYSTNHFTTYNRTLAQEAVQDLLTACAFARGQAAGARVALCGVGRVGLYAMLAAPGADAVLADACALDPGDDAALLATDLFIPGLRRIGGMEGALTLAAPRPLVLHNTAGRFPPARLRAAYGGAGCPTSLHIDDAAWSDESATRWAGDAVR